MFFIFSFFFWAQLQCFQHINRHIFHSSFQDPSINRTMMMMMMKKNCTKANCCSGCCCCCLFRNIYINFWNFIDLNRLIWFDLICSLQMLIFEPKTNLFIFTFAICSFHLICIFGWKKVRKKFFFIRICQFFSGISRSKKSIKLDHWLLLLLLINKNVDNINQSINWSIDYKDFFFLSDLHSY